MGRFLNADTLFATGQGFVGNNMFAYCLNNPTCMVDNDGLDAIYVVTYPPSKGGLPLVGHATLYIQNSSGDWVRTEYCSPDYNPKNAKISTANVTDSTIDNILKDWGRSTVYIKGDFTDSASLAFSYNGSDYGGYGLFLNNCNHYVVEILRAGKPAGAITDFTINNIFSAIPAQYLGYLRDGIALDSAANTLQQLNKKYPFKPLPIYHDPFAIPKRLLS